MCNEKCGHDNTLADRIRTEQHLKEAGLQEILAAAEDLKELALERVCALLGSSDPDGYSSYTLELSVEDDEVVLTIDFTDRSFPETPEQVVKQHADKLRHLGIAIVRTLTADLAWVPDQGKETINASDAARLTLSRVVDATKKE